MTGISPGQLYQLNLGRFSPDLYLPVQFGKFYPKVILSLGLWRGRQVAKTTGSIYPPPERDHRGKSRLVI